MSSVSNRGEGIAEKIGGKLKKTIGKLIGNPRMQAEGKAKETEGAIREESAKAAERAKGATERATGALKNRVGQVIGNERLVDEGKATELKGEGRQELNK